MQRDPGAMKLYFSMQMTKPKSQKKLSKSLHTMDARSNATDTPAPSGKFKITDEILKSPQAIRASNDETAA